jgi:radical SAM protein with 4Fe4S-binding SPASM domain
VIGKVAVGMKRLRSTGVQATRDLRDAVTHKTDSAPPIKFVDIEITVLCNLRCPFCFFWGDNGTSHKAVKDKEPRFAQPLTREEIGKMMAPLQGRGVHVYLSSAGEPFVRKDTINIIEDLSMMGFTVSLTTNATLIDSQLASRITSCKGLTSMTISIDGPEDVHDAGRGKGNFRRTVDNIAALRKAGPHVPRLWVNAVMTANLLGRTYEFGKIVRDLGFEQLRVQHMWLADRAMLSAHALAVESDFGLYDTGAEGHFMEMPGAQYGYQVAKELLETQRKIWPYNFYQSPRLTPEQCAQYYSKSTFRVSEHCGKPWVGLNIRADGEVVFCPDQWINWPIGHVKKESIDAIWTGARAMKFRRALDERGLYPGCARCCYINLQRY